MHYLYEYSTFENTEQLNKAVYLHIRNHTDSLNDTDRTTLKMIARYAVKYAGAAHLKAATIAEFIGKSEKTARRIVNKLVNLGILEKHRTVRKVNGGTGANILVIRQASDSLSETNVQSHMSSRKEPENTTDAKAELRKNEKEPSDSIKLIKNNIDDTSSIPANALRSVIPRAIYNAMSPYFNAKEMYKYYGMLLKAKRKFAPNTLIENDPEPYVEAFNGVIFRAKRGTIRNFDGYLYASFARAASEVSRRAMMTDSEEKSRILFYNWLEEGA